MELKLTDKELAAHMMNKADELTKLIRELKQTNSNLAETVSDQNGRLEKILAGPAVAMYMDVEPDPLAIAAASEFKEKYLHALKTCTFQGQTNQRRDTYVGIVFARMEELAMKESKAIKHKELAKLMIRRELANFEAKS